MSAGRIEAVDRVLESFVVWKIDLPNDNLGPRKVPAGVPEDAARARLAELGLTESEVEARIAWARQWMTTWVLPEGSDPSAWRPRVRVDTVDEILLMHKPGRHIPPKHR